MPLNAKQRRFVAEYLKDQNATQAALRSGYAKRSAGSQAWDLLQKPEIKAAVEAALAKVTASAGLTLEKHLATLEKLRELALEAGQVAPAVSAEVHRGKASGLYVERVAGADGGAIKQNLTVEFIRSTKPK